MLVPTLPALELNESIGFYEKLGFAVSARYPEHAYVILVRPSAQGEDELHLWLADDPDIPENTSIYWRVPDARAAFEAFVANGAAHAGSKPEKKPWGQWEFALTDPAGCLIRVGSPAD